MLSLTLHLHQTHSPPRQVFALTLQSRIAPPELHSAKMGRIRVFIWSVNMFHKKSWQNWQHQPHNLFLHGNAIIPQHQRTRRLRIFHCTSLKIFEILSQLVNLLWFFRAICAADLYSELSKQKESYWSLKKKDINFSFDEMQAKFQC